MDKDTRTTLMQITLAMESYLISQPFQKGIAGLSAMSDSELKAYYLETLESFNGCL